MGQLSIDRLKSFEAISWKYMDWLTVLSDAGITDVQDLSGQYLLKCPFHTDWSPSFRIRVQEHNYHCFSCNAFGTVSDLAWRLSGKTIKKSLFYEHILNRTPGMQTELGFTSLYIDKNTIDPAFSGRRVFDPTSHLGSTMPVTVLSDKVRKISDTWESLVFSLSMLQAEDFPENVLARVKTIFGSSGKMKESVGPVNLMSLVEEQEDD